MSVDHLEIVQAVELKNMTESYIDQYTEWREDDYGMFMLGDWVQRDLADIKKEFESSWGRQKVIKYLGKEVGFIKTTPDPRNRNANVALYITPKVRSKGIANVATYKLLDLVFDLDSYHKVEFTSFDFNKESLNNFKGFHLDGILREDYWYQGRYWDKHIYSVLRSEWPELREKFEERLHYVNKLWIKRHKKQQEGENIAE